MKNYVFKTNRLFVGFLALLLVVNVFFSACVWADANNQLVKIGLWHAGADKPSMGNIATDNNRVALYDSSANTLEIAMNPVDVSGYMSAVTTVMYDETGRGDFSDVGVLETGQMQTGDKNDGVDHKIDYIKRFKITLPSYLKKQGVEYIPLKMIVPHTPMDQAVGTGYLDARLRIDWDSAEQTTLKQLVCNDKMSSGTIQKVEREDELTGIYLEADSFKVTTKAQFKVDKITEGKDYDRITKLLSKDNIAIFKISLLNEGVAIQPRGAVLLKFPYTGDKIKIYRIDDSGKKTKLNGALSDKDYTLLSSKLGFFAIVNGKENAIVTTKPVKPTVDPKKENSAFSDLKEHWAEEYVKKAVARGLFKGTSATTFSPNQPMTGGMIITVIYRMAGEPAVVVDGNLPNIKKAAWYEKAAAWGFKNKLIGGYKEFLPEKPLTREELATILYRYTLMKKQPAIGEIKHFKDYNTIAPWAKDALAWANLNGIIKGRSADKIAPKGNATRAEVATILCRFAELTDK